MASEQPPVNRVPWLAFLEAYKVVIDKMERMYTEAGATGLVVHEVLWRLDRAPEARLRMQDLAELLLVTKSGASRLIDRLERNGLVKRSTSSEDRRVVYAVLTAKGRAALEVSREVFIRAYDDVFKSVLDAGELAEFTRLLTKMIERNRLPAATAAAAAGVS